MIQNNIKYISFMSKLNDKADNIEIIEKVLPELQYKIIKGYLFVSAKEYAHFVSNNK